MECTVAYGAYATFAASAAVAGPATAAGASSVGTVAAASAVTSSVAAASGAALAAMAAKASCAVAAVGVALGTLWRWSTSAGSEKDMAALKITRAVRRWSQSRNQRPILLGTLSPQPAPEPVFLGRGAFATVYRASVAGEWLAMKVMHSAQQLVAERKALEALTGYEFIVQLHHVFEPNVLYLELCDEPLVPGDHQTARQWAFQLCTGLTAIHWCGFIHRDINPNNLMCRGHELRICDFGDSVLEDEADTRVVGTVAYMSPEVLSGMPQSCAIDMWSAGMSIYFLFTGRILLDMQDGRDRLAEAMFAIRSQFPDNSVATMPEGVQGSDWQKILHMLAVNPRDRIMAADASEEWELHEAFV